MVPVNVRFCGTSAARASAHAIRIFMSPLLLRCDGGLAPAQDEFLDLAGGGLRQLGDEVERVRALEVRKRVANERAQLLGRRRRARPEDDERVRRLSPS